MDSLALLQFLIYFVFIFSIIAYATLDGFDLGVGALHLFAKTDEERRLMINAIGPVWDGNTTWIVIGSGVLFAGFPKVFASLMAGFYTPLMFLIFAFMMRGAAIEFRGKKEGRKWRQLWDLVFFGASLILALDIGLLLGNLVEGLPLNGQGEVQVERLTLLRPYPLLIALFALSLFMMHGSLYLLMKTEGALHTRLRGWAKRLIALFLLFWLLTTAATFVFNTHMIKPILERPYLGIFALLSFFCIGTIPYAVKKNRDGWAFIASCFSIVFLLALFAVGTFPYIVYSTLDPAQNSLTLYNSSASEITLFVLTMIALTGIPLSFFYGSYVYKVFRGKIKLDHMSY